MALTDLTLRLPDLEAPSATGASWTNPYPYPSFELPSGTVTVRTNGVKNPALATGAPGWGGSGVGSVLGTPARSAGAGHGGSVGWQSTATGTLTPNAHGLQVGNSTGDHVVVTAGQTIFPSMYVHSTRASRFGLLLAFYDISNAMIGGTVSVAAAQVAASTQTRLQDLAGTVVPASAVRMLIRVVPVTGTGYDPIIAGDVLTVSKASTAPGPYFDGNTPAAGDFEYVWSGTENASTSIMRAKALLGVSDPGVYQSQEWSAEGTHSAFVPTGKTLTVALAEPSTVKVIARSAGQTIVGSTGVEEYRSYAFNPNALVSPGGYGVAASGGTGATVSSTSYETSGGPLAGEVDTYAKCTLTALTSGSPIINWTVGSASTTGRYFPVAQGEVWTIQVRVRRTDKTGNVQVGIVEYSSTPTYLQDNMASATSVNAGAWTYISKSVTVTNASAARAMVKVYFTQTDTSSVGDEFGISAIVVTKTASAPLSGMFFSGNTLPSASGYPVWAGTPDESETILYGVNTDTATGADETLEVQATGRVALLGGYWDVLTIVAGTYTGPPFTGSSDITGYETAWLGAINESASTLTELIPGSPPIREVVSWSVTEPGTPHNISSSGGSTGTARVTVKAHGDSYWSISEPVDVTVAGVSGSLIGTVDSAQVNPYHEHGEPGGTVTLSVASVLNLLNAERTLAPIMEEPLSAVFSQYVAAVTPLLSVTWLATSDPIRTYGAWSGNVWSILKTLCSANRVEIALNGGQMIVRDIGTSILRLDGPAQPGLDIENVAVSISPGTGQFVEIIYRDARPIDNLASYNYSENPSVEVNADGWGVRTLSNGAIEGSRVTN